MLSNLTKRAIEAKCKTICETFSVDHVFFAQVLGQRQHYLAGHGSTMPAKTEHQMISPHIVMCWQGTLPCERLSTLRRDLADLLERVESELAEEDAAC